MDSSWLRALCLSVMTAAVALAVAGPSVARPTPAGSAGSASTSSGLKCTNRVEAGFRRPRAGDRVVERHLAFVNLGRAVRGGSAHRLPPPNPWAPFQPVQTQLLLRDGLAVSISVPRAERRYLRLLYNPPGTKLGKGRRIRVAATACQHSSVPAEARTLCGWSPYKACLGYWTEFEGGLLIDYRRAGKRLNCAYLLIRFAGRPAVRVRLLRTRTC